MSLEISGSWAPANFLNWFTAFSCLISRAMQGPLVKLSTSWGNSGTTPFRSQQQQNYYLIITEKKKINHLFDISYEEYYFIDFKKFFWCWSIERKALQCRDFKSFLQNYINNLSRFFFEENVRLYHTACAVIEYCCGLQSIRKEEANFSLCRLSYYLCIYLI